MTRDKTARCAEGHSLAVWDEDFEPEEMDADALAETMEEQSAIDHLRGANWHVMSLDDELLDDMESEFGGERSETGWPDFPEYADLTQ